MTRADSHRWRNVVLLGLVVAACGGKVTDDGASQPATADAATPVQPPPTCAQICERLSGQCGGATSPGCVSSCNTTTQQFASCTTQLDAFLRCMGSAHVQCQKDVVVIDCSNERTTLETCKAK